jgi:hypothetical protein
MRTKQKRLKGISAKCLEQSKQDIILSIGGWGAKLSDHRSLDLEAEITGEEVNAIIGSILKENASGPDGFIGAFYHKC